MPIGAEENVGGTNCCPNLDFNQRMHEICICCGQRAKKKNETETEGIKN